MSIAGEQFPAAKRTDLWATPPFILDALGGWQSFDLDPCAMASPPYPTARQSYTELDKGLMLPWNGRVWLNPPYSVKLLSAFMEKLAQHEHGTALIFAKTETKVFFDCVWEKASAVLFIKNRLHFYDPTGQIAPYNGGAPSVLVAYGRQDADILAAEPVEGKFIPLRIPCSWLVQNINRTWKEALDEFFTALDRPARLEELYEAFSRDPKTRQNPNYRAKLRQTLKRARYVNVGRGLWARA